MKHTRTALCLVAAALVLASCGGSSTETLRLMTHESFAGSVDDETFAPFTDQTGIAVEVIPAGDAGSMVNQAALTKENPLADVLFGVDDTFLSRALDEGIFSEYRSANLDQIREDFLRDDYLVTPIDFGDVCFNYDKGWFEGAGTPVPGDLEQLRSEAYAGLVTVEHPATSSPGLAFMLATIDLYGEEGWLDWWADMRDAGVNIANDWDTAYYGEFTRYGGEHPIVMSYASSPPAEVLFAEEPLDEAPTGVLGPGCYRQVEYAGVLAGTEYPEEAGALIDYMLTVEFQEQIPLTWFVFPVNENATLPEEFVEHTVIPSAPSRLDADYIAENRDRWIDEWLAVMAG